MIRCIKIVVITQQKNADSYLVTSCTSCCFLIFGLFWFPDEVIVKFWPERRKKDIDLNDSLRQFRMSNTLSKNSLVGLYYSISYGWVQSNESVVINIDLKKTSRQGVDKMKGVPLKNSLTSSKPVKWGPVQMSNFCRLDSDCIWGQRLRKRRELPYKTSALLLSARRLYGALFFGRMEQFTNQLDYVVFSHRHPVKELRKF